MTVEEVKTESGIQLDVEGKVDSNSYVQFQDQILKSFQKTNNVVVNLEKTAYISSAGLRALFLGHKTATSKGGSMKIINVNDQIMDVFRVTGFDKTLDIRKAG